jgi:hypothetical protein
MDDHLRALHDFTELRRDEHGGAEGRRKNEHEEDRE